MVSPVPDQCRYTRGYHFPWTYTPSKESDWQGTSASHADVAWLARTSGSHRSITVGGKGLGRGSRASLVAEGISGCGMAWAYWVTGERVLARRCQSDRVARRVRVCWRRRVCRGTVGIRGLRPRGVRGPDILRRRDSDRRLHPSNDRGHVAFDRLAGAFGLGGEADAEKPPGSVVVGQAIVVSVEKTSVGFAVLVVASGYAARRRDLVGDRGDGPLIRHRDSWLQHRRSRGGVAFPRNSVRG